MPIAIPDRELEELEVTGDLRERKSPVWLRLGGGEDSTGRIPASFGEDRASQCILCGEAEIPFGSPEGARVYHRGSRPADAVVVIGDNSDIEDVRFDNDGAATGYVALNNDAATDGNVANSWLIQHAVHSTVAVAYGSLRKLPPNLERRIEQLRQLPENWGGPGTPRISERSLRKAEAVLFRGARILGSQFLEGSSLAPCADGGVEIESALRSGKELMLEISVAGEVKAFLLVEPFPEGGETETEGVIGGSRDLDGLLLKAKA